MAPQYSVEEFDLIIHDMRNALTVMMLNAELLREGNPEENEEVLKDMREGIEMLKTNLNRLANWRSPIREEGEGG